MQANPVASPPQESPRHPRRPPAHLSVSLRQTPATHTTTTSVSPSPSSSSALTRASKSSKHGLSPLKEQVRHQQQHRQHQKQVQQQQQQQLQQLQLQPTSSSSRKRRDGQGSSDETHPAQPQPQPSQPTQTSSTYVIPARKTSDESNHSGDGGVQGWFDRSNKRPRIALNRGLGDDEPPYYLPQTGSSPASNLVPDASVTLRPGLNPAFCSNANVAPGLPQTVTRGSSADDFRSVIDDLTIENQKLKERLRRFEASYSAQLEKDVLFEVKMHGLPSKKKRELEEKLRSFAASINSSSSETRSAKTPRVRAPRHHKSPPSKNTSLSSTESRPNDSAYASMSASGPHSSATTHHSGGLAVPADHAAPSQKSKDQNVQSYLHNIPEGLLPKHSMVMTERQKQKLVVQRLEQLFTGKTVGATVGDHTQPRQQQEVSFSAAKADEAKGARHVPDGEREARILPYEMDPDHRKQPKMAEDAATDGSDPKGHGGSSNGSPDQADQRPTRPLDLDPDREQVPAENMAYIRHLGLPTLAVGRGGHADAAASDGDGWIYLNLLINMAQLHIVNVTPDFVRGAVSDMSDKFQLSRDGRRIRWRGGTEGTRFTSDSGSSSARQRSFTDRDVDSVDEIYGRRRKLDGTALADLATDGSDQPDSWKMVQHNPLYYKPLFHHRGYASEAVTSYHESDSPYHNYEETNGSGRDSRVPRLRSRGSHSMSGGRARRRNDGPIVFYSGLPFCTDLSGDRGNISTPLHRISIGQSGYSNHAQEALGCAASAGKPKLSRTPSGSFLPFRPFKDYSKGPDLFQTEATRPKTPELIAASDDDDDFEMSLQWTIGGSPKFSPLGLTASGLGGTQPADHFAVRVETRRTILGHEAYAPSPRNLPPSARLQKMWEHVCQLSAARVPSEVVKSTSGHVIGSMVGGVGGIDVEDLPVQTDIVGAKFARLSPSAIPPPLGYYADHSSDSDTDMDDMSNASSFSGIEHLRRQRIASPSVSISDYQPPVLRRSHSDSRSTSDRDEAGGGGYGDDGDDDDDDNSIDMLAAARKADPKLVAAREEAFEMEARRNLAELPVGSTAATVDGGSGFASSAGAQSDGEGSESEDSSEDMLVDG